MFFVRSTTYCGHRITVENGRPGAIQRAQYRYFIKEGVLDITLEEHREYQAQGEKNGLTTHASNENSSISRDRLSTGTTGNNSTPTVSRS